MSNISQLVRISCTPLYQNFLLKTLDKSINEGMIGPVVRIRLIEF